MDEIKVINKFLTKLAYDKSSLDLKDDVFFNKKNNLVISTDTYVEGVHFIDFKKPKLVIKKILRSSISDLLCKGVKPKYYFISAAGNNLLFKKNVLKKITNSLCHSRPLASLTAALLAAPTPSHHNDHHESSAGTDNGRSPPRARARRPRCTR